MLNYIETIIKRFTKSQLLTGSLIMMIGGLITGFGNYLFHLLMGRMLGPVDYGILASLISLLYLLSIPVGTLNLVIVKFVSTLKGQKKLGAVGSFFKVVNQKVFFLGLAMLLVYFILNPILTSFLHLNSSLPLIIIGGIALIVIMTMINRATLQGLLRFNYLAASNVSEIVVKLPCAVLLVIWGLKVNGALLAIVIGGMVAYSFSLFPLRQLLAAKTKSSVFAKKEILSFAVPVFLSTLAFTSLYTTDIILVRHFLIAQQAGFYAALATLGKIIYFVSLPIILVLFPMVAERHANGQHYRPLLFASSALVGLAGFGITLIYFLFPGLMVKTLFGSDYLPAASNLGAFAIFLSLYSFSFLLVNFNLSIDRTKVVLLPIVAAILQIILISLFHQNIGQIISISIGITVFLLFSLLIFGKIKTTKK